MSMNLEQLEKSNKIIYSVVAGSHAYGTNDKHSDMDIRGYFYQNLKERDSFLDSVNQIGDKKSDVVYLSVKRAFELLMTANPNQIELLWIPDDCIKIMHPAMKVILDNRNLFISKKAFHTHAQYADVQVKKSKGQNKRVNNPQSREMPCRSDFCHIIKENSISLFNIHFKPPFRPVPLRQSGINLMDFNVSSLEHSQNIYRLYYYGDKARGVFTSDGQLVCQSIPLKDERTRFYGLLIYNEAGYNHAVREWKQYWEWMENRNEKRWVDQENGKVDYDAKNMSHCMRLLYSCESILKNGYPIVRFEGDLLNKLMEIKAGKYNYEKLMDEVAVLHASTEELKDKSDIPDSVDLDKLTDLYHEVNRELDSINLGGS